MLEPNQRGTRHDTNLISLSSETLSHASTPHRLSTPPHSHPPEVPGISDRWSHQTRTVEVGPLDFSWKPLARAARASILATRFLFIAGGRFMALAMSECSECTFGKVPPGVACLVDWLTQKTLQWSRIGSASLPGDSVWPTHPGVPETQATQAPQNCLLMGSKAAYLPRK